MGLAPVSGIKAFSLWQLAQGSAASSLHLFFFFSCMHFHKTQSLYCKWYEILLNSHWPSVEWLCKLKWWDMNFWPVWVKMSWQPWRSNTETNLCYLGLNFSKSCFYMAIRAMTGAWLNSGHTWKQLPIALLPARGTREDMCVWHQQEAKGNASQSSNLELNTLRWLHALCYQILPWNLPELRQEQHPQRAHLFPYKSHHLQEKKKKKSLCGMSQHQPQVTQKHSLPYSGFPILNVHNFKAASLIWSILKVFR